MKGMVEGAPGAWAVALHNPKWAMWPMCTRSARYQAWMRHTCGILILYIYIYKIVLPPYNSSNRTGKKKKKRRKQKEKKLIFSIACCQKNHRSGSFSSSSFFLSFCLSSRMSFFFLCSLFLLNSLKISTPFFSTHLVFL